eukprot:6190369-Pleurochrysis_carterae.AAC.1
MTCKSLLFVALLELFGPTRLNSVDIVAQTLQQTSFVAKVSLIKLLRRSPTYACHTSAQQSHPSTPSIRAVFNIGLLILRDPPMHCRRCCCAQRTRRDRYDLLAQRAPLGRKQPHTQAPTIPLERKIRQRPTLIAAVLARRACCARKLQSNRRTAALQVLMPFDVSRALRYAQASDVTTATTTPTPARTTTTH